MEVLAWWFQGRADIITVLLHEFMVTWDSIACIMSRLIDGDTSMQLKKTVVRQCNWFMIRYAHRHMLV